MLQRYKVAPLGRDGSFSLLDLVPDIFRFRSSTVWVAFEEANTKQFLEKGHHEWMFYPHTALRQMSLDDVLVIGVTKQPEHRWKFKIEDFDERFIVLRRI